MNFLQAVEKKDLINIAVALYQGVDIECTDATLSRPLHIATLQGHSDIIQILIKCKADINAQNIFGWTPLHLAVYNQRHNIVKLLKEHQADTRIRDVEGRIPDQIDVDLETGELFIWRPEYHAIFCLSEDKLVIEYLMLFYNLHAFLPREILFLIFQLLI